VGDDRSLHRSRGSGVAGYCAGDVGGERDDHARRCRRLQPTRPPSLFSAAHPDIEWYPVTAQAEGGGVFRGHAGVREWWANTDAAFDEIEIEVTDTRDLGDELVFFGRIRGRFRSGVPFDSEVGYHSRFRDALVIHARSWWSHAEALEASGLSE
jgi:ketosteroid isomerase-like protein